MARILAIVLLFFVSLVSVQASADATAAEGPLKKLKIFSKNKPSKVFKKKNKKTKYYRKAANKQRKAKWQRYSILGSNR